jgi:hypothetical protein
MSFADHCHGGSKAADKYTPARLVDRDVRFRARLRREALIGGAEHVGLADLTLTGAGPGLTLTVADAKLPLTIADAELILSTAAGRDRVHEGGHLSRPGRRD